jgi:putative ABC transport system substrate-binding protein
MYRRGFIGVLGTLLSWPATVRAQKSIPQVVGFLSGASRKAYSAYLAAFLEGLREGGYVEGENVRLEYRWAENQYDKLPALAAELLNSQVAVIAATGTPAAVVARSLVKTIPVVFSMSGDPVALGVVTSLNRPGGNATGSTRMSVELSAKRIEILHEIVPDRTALALLINPTGPNAAAVVRDSEAAARALGRRLEIIEARNTPEIEGAFSRLKLVGAQGLVVGTDPLFNSQAHQLADLGLKHRLPVVYQYDEFTTAGGLASYGGGIKESYRIAGAMTAKVLKGEKPADLPVQQSTRIELSLNLKTAKVLGITVPTSLLGRADELIE